MYRNPCGGGCNALGAYDEVTQAVETNGAAWWEGPVTQIVGAVSTRIAGPDSGYPPGSYEWDYNRQVLADAPRTYARAPNPLATPLVLGAVALAAVLLLR